MKIKKSFILTLLVLAIMPMFAFAINPLQNPFGYINPSDGEPIAAQPVTDLPASIAGLVNWFAWFTALVSVAIGLYAGFLFITARGETAQLATAKKTLLYAVIGIAVAVASFSIISITKVFI